MNILRYACVLGALALAGVAPARAEDPPAGGLPRVIEQVNQKVVKLFGAGGFRGVTAYGTGILISPDGFILTVANPLLDTQDLRVHLYDGRRLHAKVVVIEPELDLALVKIDKEKLDDLPCFDVLPAARRPAAAPGTRVLAFSNMYEFATRDEPVSVQQGTLAAHSKLIGRRGVFEVAFGGDVYVLDTVTNNPGASGGALTTYQGELLGVLGKELKNANSDTWINYAIPLQTRVEFKSGDKVTSVSVAEFVDKGMAGSYKPAPRAARELTGGGYHGIVLVPNVVERTPPFVEEVVLNSPGARAGLKPDDLIVYVDGERVVSIKEFRDIVSRTLPGTVLKLEVRRGDRLTGVELKLEEMPKAPPKK